MELWRSRPTSSSTCFGSVTPIVPSVLLKLGSAQSHRRRESWRERCTLFHGPPPLLRPRHRARWPAACGSIAQSSPLCASRWRPGSCPARATGLHKLLCDVILHTHQRRAMGCRRENARDLRPACTQRAGNGAVTHVCRERRARLRATRCGGHLLASLAYPRVSTRDTQAVHPSFVW